MASPATINFILVAAVITTGLTWFIWQRIRPLVRDRFNAIGFCPRTPEDFKHLARVAMIDGERIPIDQTGTSYFQLTLPEGPQLWVRERNEREIMDLYPGYRGQFPLRMIIAAVHRHPNDADDAWFAGDTETTQFVFHVPGYLRYRQLVPGNMIEVRLALLAENIEVFRDREEYESKSVWGRKMWATQAFIPTGQFGPVGKDGMPEVAEVPEPTGLVIGEVIRAVERTNTETRQRFVLVQVRTLDCKMDILADAKRISVPAPGAIVVADGWLTGSIDAAWEEDQSAENAGDDISP